MQVPSACVSLVIPPIASFALRGTARELTWYCFVALTPSDAGIACSESKICKQHQSKAVITSVTPCVTFSERNTDIY